ncbi:MAG: hypothetical protein PHX30_05310 [Candidatus Pacebacteria bacterium]|nr:hypothetical protein [Candidatus Paceibacterota bacterium]
MERKQKNLIMIALVIFFFGLRGQTVEAATIRVSGNNDVAIQSALDKAANGDTVVVPAGEYYLTKQIYQKGKSLSLIGEGTVNFYLQAPAARAADVHFMGSFIANRRFGANAKKGDSQVILTDASQVISGDLIKIWKDVQWCPLDYPDQPTGEMYLIKSVSGNVVTLNQPLLRDYSLTQSPQADIYRPVEIHVDNIRFHDSGATTMHESLGILYGINSSVTNSWFSDSGMSAVSFYSSFDIRVEKNEIRNCILSGSGYGIGIWDSTAFAYVADNYVENCRHAVTGNESERKGLIRDVLITGNTFKGASINGANVIDAHNVVIDYTVTKNKVYPTANFYAFADGSEQSTFSDNEIYGGYGAVIRRGSVNGGTHIIKDNYTEGSTASFTYRGYGTGTGGVSDTLIIVNNRQVGGRYGINFSDQMPEAFKNIIISGNSFSNITEVGVSIKFYMEGTNIQISDNTFENVARGGIYLDVNGHTNGDIAISNNTLKNVSSGSSSPGISIAGIKNANICSNTVSDTSERMTYGIYEGSGCSNNSIFGNSITGFTKGDIYTGGATMGSSTVCPIGDIVIPDISSDNPDSSLEVTTYPLIITNGDGKGSYAPGTQVTITANAPATGKIFDKWTGNTSYIADVNSATTTITIPAFAIALTATYKDISIPTYALTVINGDGKGYYTSGTQVTVIANTPVSSKITFDKWTGDTQYLSSTISSITTLTMPDKAITLTATYRVIAQSEYLLTVTNGSGNGSYAPDTQVIIKADTPPTGEIFSRWAGNTSYVADINSATTTVAMPSSAITLTATYKNITDNGNLPDGTLIKLPDSPKTYVIVNGEKKWISTPEQFEQLGYQWTEVQTTTEEILTALKDIEDNLIRLMDDLKVYLVTNGTKRHIPNPDIFLNYGFSWNDIKDVDQSVMDKYQEAHLIRETGKEAVYYFTPEGIRKHIPTADIFNSYNNKWEDVQVISQNEMESYPASNLVRLKNDNDVYLIEGPKKRRVPSVSVFNKHQYAWNHVISINQVEFDYYQTGAEVE